MKKPGFVTVIVSGTLFALMSSPLAAYLFAHDLSVDGFPPWLCAAIFASFALSAFIAGATLLFWKLKSFGHVYMPILGLIFCSIGLSVFFGIIYFCLNLEVPGAKEIAWSFCCALALLVFFRITMNKIAWE